MSRKHYRAVQKKVEQSPANGIFVPNKQKNKLICLGVGIIVLSFLKGLLFGYIVGKENK